MDKLGGYHFLGDTFVIDKTNNIAMLGHDGMCWYLHTNTGSRWNLTDNIVEISSNIIRTENHIYRKQSLNVVPKKYYKVVCKDDLKSFGKSNGPEYTVQYKVNEFVYATNNTLLFVFDNYDMAVKWIEGYSHTWCIYEAECIGVTKYNSRVASVPEGTVFAKAVKITHKVWG